MHDALTALNQLVADGVIPRYAIGASLDYYRVSLFIEADVLDIVALDSLLTRYYLRGRTTHVLNWPSGDAHGRDESLD